MAPYSAFLWNDRTDENVQICRGHADYLTLRAASCAVEKALPLISDVS